MSGEPATINHGPGQAVSVRLIGYDRPFIVLTLACLSLALSSLCFIYCMSVSIEAQRRAYFASRCESFVEMAVTQGKQVWPNICETQPKEK